MGLRRFVQDLLLGPKIQISYLTLVQIGKSILAFKRGEERSLVNPRDQKQPNARTLAGSLLTCTQTA